MFTENVKVGGVYWCWLIEGEQEEVPKQYTMLSKRQGKVTQVQDGMQPMPIYYQIEIFDIESDKIFSSYEHYKSELFFNTREECIDNQIKVFDFYNRIKDYNRKENLEKYLAPYVRYKKLTELIK